MYISTVKNQARTRKRSKENDKLRKKGEKKEKINCYYLKLERRIWKKFRV